jgi:hypothetical protein
LALFRGFTRAKRREKLVLLVNFSLGWRCLLGTNALAFYSKEKIATVKKVLIKHAPVTQKAEKKFYFIVAEIMQTLKY